VIEVGLEVLDDKGGAVPLTVISGLKVWDVEEG